MSQSSTSYPSTYSHVPANTLLPPGEQVYDWNMWKGQVIKHMATNIANNTGAGYPAGWTYGSYDMDIGTGNVSAGTLAMLSSYMDSYQPGQDTWIDNLYPMPSRNSTTMVETPEAVAFRIANEQWEKTHATSVEQWEKSFAQGINEFNQGMALSVRQQDFREYQFAVELALSQQARAGSGGGGRVGGGGGTHYGGTDMAASQLALQRAKLNLEAEIARGSLELDKLNSAAEREYKAALIESMAAQQQLAQQQFAHQREQDQIQNTLQLQGLRQQRADTIAQLSANPRDMVQREYRLHMGEEPTGTRQDIFTGNQGGQSTLSQLMAEQAPLVNNGLSGAMQQPPPPQQPPQPQQQPPPPPGLASGSVGYTREPRFIVGDSRSGQPTGVEELIENPTNAPIRVKPLSIGEPVGLSRYAVGTGPKGMSSIAPQGGEIYRNPSLLGSGQQMTPTQQRNHDFWEQQEKKAQQQLMSPPTTTKGKGAPVRPVTYTDYSGDRPVGSTQSAPVQTGFHWIDGVQTQVAMKDGQWVPYDQYWDPVSVDSTFVPDDPNSAPGQHVPGVQGEDPMTLPPPRGDQDKTVKDPNWDYTTGVGIPLHLIPPESQTRGQIYTYAGQGGAFSVDSLTPGLFLSVRDRNGSTWRRLGPGEMYDPAIHDDLVSIQSMPGWENPAYAGGETAATDQPASAGATPTVGDPDGTGGQQQQEAPPQGTNGTAQPPPGYRPPDPNTLSVILQPGTATTPGGGGSYRFTGDGSEAIGPDGIAYRLNSQTGQWLPMEFVPTTIGMPGETAIQSFRRFLELPQEVQQAIRRGDRTGYVLDNTNGWVSRYLSGPAGGYTPPRMGQSDFYSLPEEDQARLLFSSRPSVSRDGTTGVDPQTGLFSLAEAYGTHLPSPYQNYYRDSPLGQQGVSSMADYLTLQSIAQGGTPAPSAPPTAQPSQERARWQWGGAINPPASPPPPGTPPPGNEPPPPAGGNGTPPPGDGGTPDLNAPLPPGSTLADILNWLENGGFDVLQYGGDVYQDLPSLQLLSGNIPLSQYQTVDPSGSTVPGLGVDLPGAGHNFSTLAYLQQYAPDAFEALSSLFEAGNRSLPAEMALAASRAPLGTAYQPTLIAT